MFVYDQFTISIWYTATLNNVGGFTWTGDLFLPTAPGSARSHSTGACGLPQSGHNYVDGDDSNDGAR